MKNILAIDTSSAYLSLGLQVGDKVYKYINKVDNKQSENIIPQIKVLLTEVGIAAKDITHIAYNQGPGSFTGLRVGLSVALGIAFGVNARLIPIPAFAIYALQAYELTKNLECTRILVGLDARLNQLYFAGIDAKTFEYFIEPKLTNPADIVLIDNMENMSTIGTGFTQYSDTLPDVVKQQVLPNLINPQAYPDATYLLKLANSGKFSEVPATQADLLYLRDKVALNLAEQSATKR